MSDLDYKTSKDAILFAADVVYGMEDMHEIAYTRKIIEIAYDKGRKDARFAIKDAIAVLTGESFDSITGQTSADKAYRILLRELNGDK